MPVIGSSRRVVMILFDCPAATRNVPVGSTARTRGVSAEVGVMASRERVSSGLIAKVAIELSPRLET